MLLEAQIENKNTGKKLFTLFNPLAINQTETGIKVTVLASALYLNEEAKKQVNSPSSIMSIGFAIQYSDFLKYAQEELERPNNPLQKIRLYGPSFQTHM